MDLVVAASEGKRPFLTILVRKQISLLSPGTVHLCFIYYIYYFCCCVSAP